MTKILLVGGGLTSAATSAFMAEKLCSSKNVQLSIWDKARGAGGRMSTSRSPNNPNCIADLGAQYITMTPGYETKHKQVYDELVQKGILAKMSSKIENFKVSGPKQDFVAPKGTSSLVKHFFGKSASPVCFGRHINNIKLTEDKKLQISTQSGEQEVFDVALLTMPVPQILQLGGMDQILQESMNSQLGQVKYTSRYGLALFYDNFEPSIQLTGQDHPVAADYIKDDPIFCYAALSGLKSNLAQNEPTSVIFHTNTIWGEKHVDTPVEQVQDILVNHYKAKYPDWPEPKSVKCQRWRYSQVASPFADCPNAVVLCEDPLLIAGGDGFAAKSNFDGCLDSAEKMVQILAAKL